MKLKMKYRYIIITIKKESTKELNENDTITGNEAQNDALTREISITKN